MVREIEGKVLLSRNKLPSNWFGVKYLFNIYKGCEHKCIYCDSRSLCYKIENFDELKVKVNAPYLLEKELKLKSKKEVIGTGAMSDPYTLSEKKYELTKKCLEVIADYKFPLHITTKSNLILRDVDILKQINENYASVAISITTADNSLAEKLEPFAPSSDERFKALGILSMLGIKTSITLMPVLPFIEDNEESISEIVKKAGYYGVQHIVPYIGVTLRDMQREYYYRKLDEKFPGIKEKYINRFGNKYNCMPENARKLTQILIESCYKHGISLDMPSYQNEISKENLKIIDI